MFELCFLPVMCVAAGACSSPSKLLQYLLLGFAVLCYLRFLVHVPVGAAKYFAAAKFPGVCLC